MKLTFFFIAWMLTFSANCQVSDYLNSLRERRSVDLQFERNNILTLGSDSLVEALQPYIQDSSVIVRNRVFDMIYRKGLMLSIHQRQVIIEKLISGCYDNDIDVRLTCINYLKYFSTVEFNGQQQEQLANLLEEKSISLNKDVILLAGYLNFGKEQLMRRTLIPDDYSRLQLYWMHLALARMGEAASLDYCIKLASEVKDQSSQVAYILPQLIYTRQLKAVDYCVRMLYSDDKLCNSPDPDKNEKICCGYRILELLAPIIVDFPYQIDESGTLSTGNYTKALYDVREWFIANPDYQISTTSF